MARTTKAQTTQAKQPKVEQAPESTERAPELVRLEDAQKLFKSLNSICLAFRYMEELGAMQQAKNFQPGPYSTLVRQITEGEILVKTVKIPGIPE